MPFFNRTIFSVVCCSLLLSCEKSTTNIFYHFNVAGDMYAGHSICFSPVPKANTGFQWDFGDGTFSNENSPCHVYSNIGPYTVKLSRDNFKTIMAKMDIVIYRVPQLTYLLNGMKTWSRSLFLHQNGSRDSTYIFSDTSFAITYVDSFSILLGNDTLKYQPYYSNDSILVFQKSVSYSTYPSAEGWTLRYNHAADSIHFSDHYVADQNIWSTADFYSH